MPRWRFGELWTHLPLYSIDFVFCNPWIALFLVFFFLNLMRSSFFISTAWTTSFLSWITPLLCLIFDSIFFVAICSPWYSSSSRFLSRRLISGLIVESLSLSNIGLNPQLWNRRLTNSVGKSVFCFFHSFRRFVYVQLVEYSVLIWPSCGFYSNTALLSMISSTIPFFIALFSWHIPLFLRQQINVLHRGRLVN